MENTYRILICDVNVCAGGHYIVHNQFLLDNIYKVHCVSPSLEISFLFNKEASSLLRYTSSNGAKVNFVEETLHKKEGFRRRDALLRYINKFTRENKIHHLLLMDVDRYQISFCLQRFTCRVSGILFRPHHRIHPSNNRPFNVVSTKVRRVKKKFLEKLLISSPNLANIFILNDREGVRLLNMIHNCNHFKYLPDPVYVFTSGGLSETKNMLNTGAYKFLIFGWLDDRKNIINILKAYDGANFTFPTELLLVGPSREEFLSRVNAELQFLSSIDSFQKKVSIRAEFVSNEEMDNYFSICDVCLLIYKDFYGSSGLLGRAALHYKKVIGSNVGVVAELITENGLGVTCDPNSIEQITSALEAINDYNVEADACSAFYKQFAPDAFLSALVQV